MLGLYEERTCEVGEGRSEVVTAIKSALRQGIALALNPPPFGRRGERLSRRQKAPHKDRPAPPSPPNCYLPQVVNEVDATCANGKEYSFARQRIRSGRATSFAMTNFYPVAYSPASRRVAGLVKASPLGVKNYSTKR